MLHMFTARNLIPGLSASLCCHMTPCKAALSPSIVRQVLQRGNHCKCKAAAYLYCQDLPCKAASSPGCSPGAARVTGIGAHFRGRDCRRQAAMAPTKGRCSLGNSACSRHTQIPSMSNHKCRHKLQLALVHGSGILKASRMQG